LCRGSLASQEESSICCLVTLSTTRQFIWGERYIDELVPSLSDTAASINADGTLATDPTFARLDCALTARNFSVIGIGFDNDAVGDRLRYDPDGTVQAFPAGGHSVPKRQPARIEPGRLSNWK